jgi:putative spermidine/putrescine transport system substrate-binding protein
MKKIFLICILAFVISCSGKKSDDQAAFQSFEETLKAAENSTVRFAMWSGSSAINNWIDTYAAPEIERRYKIKLIRVPADASVFVNRLLTEKQSGKNQGSIDLIWINGENFKNARENDLLYGPVSGSLPNFVKYVDPETVEYDFGYPVEGYEIPYGRAQFVFEYDSAVVKDIPDTYEKLMAWIKKNPGRFTYPQPPDFTGSAFIRQVFYAATGGYKQYQGEYNSELFEKNKDKAMAYLKELSPYLWNSGKIYPKSLAALETLFEKGEVLISMNYNQGNASNKILQGRYPETVRTFVMKDGSLYNTHFTAIPFNAPNRAGAMVVADFLLSPEAQISKKDPANWGDFPVLEISKLPKEFHNKLSSLNAGDATLSLEVLEKHAVPEISSQYLEALENEWEKQFTGK